MTTGPLSGQDQWESMRRRAERERERKSTAKRRPHLPEIGFQAGQVWCGICDLFVPAPHAHRPDG